jgi:ABC-type lipoprotein export system ATPase subunit
VEPKDSPWPPIEVAIIVVSHDEKIFNRFHRIFHLRDGYLERVQNNARPVVQAAI